MPHPQAAVTYRPCAFCDAPPVVVLAPLPVIHACWSVCHQHVPDAHQAILDREARIYAEVAASNER
jgi:hypothetical protein